MQEKYSEKSSYYQYLLDNDIVGKVKDLLIHAGYYIRNEDDKIHCDLHIAWDYPWHHVKRNESMDCHTWHRIMFDIVGGFVPSTCQNCWKVVVRPQSLKQLFALLDLQIRLDRHGKCGIEDRQSVFGNYGGYFYNSSFDDGIECYKSVKQAISEDATLSNLLNVVDTNNVPRLLILKRGCTEFEHALGDSDAWEITEEQMRIENLVNENFVRMPSNRLQPKSVIDHVHRKWIEFAWDRGDPTVFEFTGGRPLYPPYVTYHHVAEGIE